GNLVMFIPKIGEDLVNYMPFTALNNFLLNTPSASAPWEGVAGFGWIFTAWSLGLWFLGVIALEKRDV
ncbi:MAG: ABC transporter permease, partial [Corynebacterium sp.]|nr:ABC transporter permease [Corynebacterium sp.]